MIQDWLSAVSQSVELCVWGWHFIFTEFLQVCLFQVGTCIEDGTDHLFDQHGKFVVPGARLVFGRHSLTAANPSIWNSLTCSHLPMAFDICPVSMCTFELCALFNFVRWSLSKYCCIALQGLQIMSNARSQSYLQTTGFEISHDRP